jgi:hypothetical protein
MLLSDAKEEKEWFLWQPRSQGNTENGAKESKEKRLHCLTSDRERHTIAILDRMKKSNYIYQMTRASSQWSSMKKKIEPIC